MDSFKMNIVATVLFVVAISICVFTFAANSNILTAGCPFYAELLQEDNENGDSSALFVLKQILLMLGLFLITSVCFALPLGITLYLFRIIRKNRLARLGQCNDIISVKV